jgi:hypothetical protein
VAGSGTAGQARGAPFGSPLSPYYSHPVIGWFDASIPLGNSIGDRQNIGDRRNNVLPFDGGCGRCQTNTFFNGSGHGGRQGGDVGGEFGKCTAWEQRPGPGASARTIGSVRTRADDRGPVGPAANGFADLRRATVSKDVEPVAGPAQRSRAGSAQQPRSAECGGDPPSDCRRFASAAAVGRVIQGNPPPQSARLGFAQGCGRAQFTPACAAKRLTQD